MPGVLDTTTSHIEHPRLVAQRLMNYIRMVGVNSKMASTECGFSTAAGAMNIPTEIFYAKLQAMVKGARVAEEMIKERNIKLLLKCCTLWAWKTTTAHRRLHCWNLNKAKILYFVLFCLKKSLGSLLF